MATARVRRGRESEELVAEFLRLHGWENAERRPASLPGTDVTGIAGVAIEVKARRSFNPGEWSKQAIKNGLGGLPVVVMRPDGSGPAGVGSWPVFLSLHDFTQLLIDAGYQK